MRTVVFALRFNAGRIGAAQSRLFDVPDAIERLQLMLQADDIRDC